MENKTYPVGSLMPFLSKRETVHEIAQKLGVDMKTEKDWFFKAYKATMNIFVEHMQDFQKQSNVITQDELRSLYSTFVNVMKASRKKFDHAKNTPGKKMYAISPHGDAQRVSAFSLNEDDEDPEAKEEFILSLYREGIIGLAMQRWEQEYPDVSTTQFDPALNMAMDIIMTAAQKSPTYPKLMPSELEEIQDILIELVLSFEPAKNIFHSTEKAKRQPVNRDYVVDPDPFERGSMATIGLNEGIDSWSESKLRQFVKKEFESLIQKGDYMSKKDVKDMIRKTIVKQYKYLWEKSAFFINQI
ncbi:MAG: hypothetical protein P8J32_00140 [bacterium]|nr:hypothetical protein [bacterium]